ncbi:MAG TPA: type I DNA topoisomerase [Candidatus Latescibacteria bacterium]|nr:type I DNA topoisomerase [Candidatus Latescibacterota bacterium]HPK74842.1 type I DNA topoisomerase [Candidatus Latescibacterota bacterium]
MPRSLVIVESPAKARTINKVLGREFDVRSSMGHVRDLPENSLGVNVEEDFLPQYEVLPSKRKIVNELRMAGKNAERVYLATDPDREGEAIAWHIAEVMRLGKNRTRRITFHEITPRAIKEALDHPTELDMHKVDAQQARRVLDRLVGYQVSPLLWQTVRKGLSAGRVQSVALRMVCEREEEVLAFKPREYWTVLVALKNGAVAFEADLWKVDGKLAKIPDEAHAKALVEELTRGQFGVVSLERKRQKRRAFPPFITSTLQQEAARKLGFSTRMTMSVAQELYEGVEVKGELTGLITYMRTDSTHLAPEAVSAARQYIAETYGKEYVPARPNVFRNSKSAQEAHEAIRPTSMDRPPEAVQGELSRDQFRLYQLIWNRFVSSQMEAQELDVTELVAAGGRFQLRTTASVVAFDGFTRVYLEGQDEEKEEQEHPIPRELIAAWDRTEQGAKRSAEPLLNGYAPAKVLPEQHFTKPPSRFTEATLVKELESRGIGRPSTYAQIISTILDREYVARKEGKLVPTELGKIVNRILSSQFPDIFNSEFTAKMEEELDRVEQGSDHWKSVLKEFYSGFEATLSSAMKRRSEIKKLTVEQSDRVCEKCGKPMVVRLGPRGRFLACSGFPECRNTVALDTEAAPPEIPVPDGVTCPKCGSGMTVRNGRYGVYLACEKYPSCRGARPIPTGVPCPRPGCNGELVIRTSKRGKHYYACDQAGCTVLYWDKPVPLPEPDPATGLKFQLEKTRRDGTTIVSPGVYPPPALRRRSTAAENRSGARTGSRYSRSARAGTRAAEAEPTSGRRGTTSRKSSRSSSAAVGATPSAAGKRSSAKRSAGGTGNARK